MKASKIFILSSIIALSTFLSAKVEARLDDGFMIYNDGGSSTITSTGGSTVTNKKQIAEFQATASVAGSGNGLGFTYTTTDGSSGGYANANLQIEFAGNTYSAYCLDPGLSMPTGNLTCKAINRSPQVNALVESAQAEGANPDVTQLAYRMWAAITGWTQTYDPDFDEKTQFAFKETVADYNTILNGSEYQYENVRAEMINNGLCTVDTCKDRKSTAAFLVGGDTTQFDQAFKIATEAKAQGSYGYDKFEETQGGVSIQVLSENGRTITYKFTSTYDIPAEQFKVDGVGAKVTATQAWNGRSGTYTVTIPEGACKGSLDLYYQTKGSYECSTNSASTQTLYAYVDKVSTGVVQSVDINLFNIEGCSECCSEEPINPPSISGSVNNCCTTGGHSEMQEPPLNKLFCEDEVLKLKWWEEKCGIEYWKSDINDYCYMFCTERISVDVPGAITASSGRYFELTTTPQGTKSPYIQGFKRCRVKVDLESWFTRYQAALDNQKDAFMYFQRAGAIDKMLEEMTENLHDYVKTDITCSEPSYIYTSCPSGYDKEDVEVDCDTNRGSHSSFVKTYKLKKVEDYHYIFQSGVLDSETSYNAYDNIYLWLSYGTHKVKEFRFGNSIYMYMNVSDGQQIIDEDSRQEHLQGAQTKAKELRDQGECKVTWKCVEDLSDWEGSGEPPEPNEQEKEKDLIRTCDYDYPSEFDYTRFYMERFKEKNPEEMQLQQDLYSDATKRGKDLEDKIELCTEYFTMTDPRQIYQMNPSVGFSYSQTYLDEQAELVRDEIQVPFTGGPGCSISLAGTTGDGEIEDPQYADKYTKEQTKKEAHLSDLQDATLEWIENRSEADFDSYYDEEFKLDKKSTHDGKIQATCYWNEGTNKIYTLAQSGVATKETTTSKNFTLHQRQYQVHLTTLEGTFETFWKVSGLGSNGKFDPYFNNAGKSCAGEDPKKVGMFTCTLKVEHEVVLTGYCNGVVNENGEENCDPFKEGYELVNFKVVDPADLFPSVSGGGVPSYNGETYAHNWVIDPEGKQVLGQIESDGAKDKTYAPERLSYSFTLSPSDMQHIKAYNESRIAYGGYTDFELTCDCPSNPLPLNSTDSCKRCKSTFIENLSNGKIKIGTSTSTVTGWSNKKENLGSVRSGNHW